MPKKNLKKKKLLTQQEAQELLNDFIKMKKITSDDLAEKPDKIQQDFFRYLQRKGFATDNLVLNIEDVSKEIRKSKKQIKSSAPIRKISEKLNERYFDFKVYTDTTSIMPGMVVYDIEKVEPSAKTPYVTYRPSPRVIVSKHDNGVNGGTLFMTYAHKVSKPFDFGANGPQIISEYEAIYSPLGLDQAEYICRVLNLQSRQMHRLALAKQKIQQNHR